MDQRFLEFESKNKWEANGVLRPGTTPIFATDFGVLFEGDCCELLGGVQDDTVDTVFADPPFNLGKKYGGLVNDRQPDDQYGDPLK